ncbi:FaeA/PapI family transcriptional regulator [Halegenticoccus tardaugens]|uniref:FaeA/PapI family transcriptional regulator n=1 Tax=Halegenticoccus tardaugens TaxID=2071624 RepID=UPI00100B9780|nr:FaeA/PapI family transcriptional regulator [Halegenticoccus tardaugens]
MSRERNEHGQWVEKITPDRVLDVIREHDAPFVTTRDIAEALDCTTEAARQKLMQLHDEGAIDRRKVGGRAVVWWLVEETVAHDVDPSDPFFSADTYTTDGPTDASERVDELLYER